MAPDLNYFSLNLPCLCADLHTILWFLIRVAIVFDILAVFTSSDFCPLLLFSRTIVPFSCPTMEDTWTWSPRWLSREMNWKDFRRKGKKKIISLNHTLPQSKIKNLHICKVKPIRCPLLVHFRSSEVTVALVSGGA